MSTYNVLGTQIGLPLTVDSVKEKVEELKSVMPLLDYGQRKVVSQEFYRDVLMAIRGGAAHARELAEAVLEMQQLING